MDDNRYKLYERLSENYDMGDFAQFDNDLDDEDNQLVAWNAVGGQEGYGDFDLFKQAIQRSPQQVEQPQAQQQGVTQDAQQNVNDDVQQDVTDVQDQQNADDIVSDDATTGVTAQKTDDADVTDTTETATTTPTDVTATSTDAVETGNVEPVQPTDYTTLSNDELKRNMGVMPGHELTQRDIDSRATYIQTLAQTNPEQARIESDRLNKSINEYNRRMMVSQAASDSAKSMSVAANIPVKADGMMTEELAKEIQQGTSENINKLVVGDGKGNSPLNRALNMPTMWVKFQNLIEGCRKLTDEQLQDIVMEGANNRAGTDSLYFTDEEASIHVAAALKELEARQNGSHAKSYGEDELERYYNNTYIEFDGKHDEKRQKEYLDEVRYHQESYNKGRLNHATILDKNPDAEKDCPVYAVPRIMLDIWQRELKKIALKSVSPAVAAATGTVGGWDMLSASDFDKVVTDAVRIFGPEKMQGYILSWVEMYQVPLEQAEQEVASMIQRQFIKLSGIKPSNDIEYTLGSVVNNVFPAQLIKAIWGATHDVTPKSFNFINVQQQTYKEYEDQSASGFAKVTAPVLTLVADTYAGGFFFPTKIAQLSTAGMTRLLTSGTNASMRSLAESALWRIEIGALGGAANFATYEVQSMATQQLATGAYRLDRNGKKDNIWSSLARLSGSLGHAGVSGGSKGLAFGTIGETVGKAFSNVSGWTAYLGEGVKFLSEGGAFTLMGYLENGKVTYQDIGTNFGMALSGKVMHADRLVKDIRARVNNEGIYGKKVNYHKISDDQVRMLTDKGYASIAYALQGNDIDANQLKFMKAQLKQMREDKSVPWEIVRMADWVLNGQLTMPARMKEYTVDPAEGGGYYITAVDADGRAILGGVHAKNENQKQAIIEQLDHEKEKNSWVDSELKKYHDIVGRELAMSINEYATEKGLKFEDVFKAYMEANAKDADEMGLGDVEREIYEGVNAVSKKKGVPTELRDTKQAIGERFGVDLDEAINTRKDKRSEAQNQALKHYQEYLDTSGDVTDMRTIDTSRRTAADSLATPTPERSETVTPRPEAPSDDQKMNESLEESLTGDGGTTLLRERVDERKKENPDTIEKTEVEKWRGGAAVGNVVVVHSLDEVNNSTAYDQIVEAERKGNQRVTGWYDTKTDTAYVYMPHILDSTDLHMTLMHEVIAHKGIRGLFKNDQEGYNKLLDEVYKEMGALRDYYDEYPGGKKGETEIEHQRRVADEFLAVWSEDVDLDKKTNALWGKVRKGINNWMRKHGITVIDTEEYDDLIRRSYQEFLKKNGVEGRDVAEKRPAEQTPTEPAIIPAPVVSASDDENQAKEIPGEAVNENDIAALFEGDSLASLEGDPVRMQSTIEDLERQRQAAHAYANGEIDELPMSEDMWKYWKGRDGLSDPQPKQPAQPVVSETPPAVEQPQVVETPAPANPEPVEPAKPVKPVAKVTAGNPMPMHEVDGKQRADFSATTPQKGHEYIYNELGISKEQADEIVASNIADAEAQLAEIDGRKPQKNPGEAVEDYVERLNEWQAEKASAQRELDYWNQVKAHEDTQAATPPAAEPQVEEVAPRTDGKLPKGASAEAETLDPATLPSDERLEKWTDAWGNVTRVEVVGENGDGTTRVRLWFKHRPDSRGVEHPGLLLGRGAERPAAVSDDQKMSDMLDRELGDGGDGGTLMRVRDFDDALKDLNKDGISIDNAGLLDEYGLKNVTLSKRGDHVTLTHFIADEQGQGNGTRFMEDLAKLADQNGWTLALTPDTSFGGTSVKRLKDFYKRFGFKDNKGSSTDFNTRESMVRKPQDSGVNFRVHEDERREQTHSENFKRWFGDWEKDPENASKVIDENGEPLVVYRGGEKINTFEKDRASKMAMYGQAFYATPSRYDAEGFARERTGDSGNVQAVYIDIRNPWVDSTCESMGYPKEASREQAKELIGLLKEKGLVDGDIILAKWEQGRVRSLLGALAEAEYEGRARGRFERWHASDIVQDALKELGYDGVIGRFNSGEGMVDQVAAFEPTQIKSATENNGDFSRENPDIRFRTREDKERRDSEESKKLFDAAKTKFGVTDDIREAGYILPDGSMLDFSGRHELMGADDSFLSGTRTTDHRGISDVSFVYDQDGNEVETGVSTDMADFISRGAIRIDNNAGSINLSMAPTREQETVLRRLIANNDGNVWVDFGDGNTSEHYAEYSGAKATRVLGDIDRYYSEGIKPQGNTLFRVRDEEKKEIDKGIRDAMGTTIEGMPEDDGIRFSTRSGVNGAGLSTYYKDEQGYERVRHDKEGNAVFTLGDKEFSVNNPVTAQDLKGTDSPLNFMMKHSLDLGLINQEQADKIYDQYSSILNTYLERGSAKNGGFGNMVDTWQYVADTVYRTVAANSDKQYAKSLDVTRVCKKNEMMIKEMSELQVRQGYGITPGQILDLYYNTIDAGYQVPCPVCYVFSRYIYNGRYATAAVNGFHMYGEHMPNGSDPWTAQQWVEEMNRLNKQLNPKQGGYQAKKNKKAYDQATKDVTQIPTQMDKLRTRINNGGINAEERASIEQEIAELDARYRKAVDIWSKWALSNWIKSFAIQQKKGRWVLRDDAAMPEDLDDFMMHAMDLRRTSETMIKYPGIQRLRKSAGSAGGKEITFVSENDLGEVIMGLGLATPDKQYANLYKEAYEAKDPKVRAKKLADAKKRMEAAAKYVAMQNLRGGVRMWSWSDNIERLAPDIAFNLMQLEMLGGGVQTYSKQLEGIELAASMGAYVNGSLMAHNDGYQVVTDADVEIVNGQKVLNHDITETITENIPSKYGGGTRQVERVLAEKGSHVYERDGVMTVAVFDDVIGIDPYGRTEPDGKKTGLFGLNKLYDRAGNIIVGMNDTHIRTVLADPRVFFCIPWHSSGAVSHVLNQMLEFLGQREGVERTDYTKMQEEKHFSSADNVGEETNALWEKHKNERDYACGIEGGIDSSQARLSDSQRHYRALRDFIFSGFKKPSEKEYNEAVATLEKLRNEPREDLDKDKLKKLESDIAKQESVIELYTLDPEQAKREIENDLFLSQTKRHVDAEAGGQMTSGDSEFVYPYEYWDEHSTYDTADVNTPRYLEYCRRLGIRPKFSGDWSKKSAEARKVGDFTEDKGYWKLLIDRRMYDRKGNYQSITPIDSGGFRPEMIDPDKTREKYHVTEVADDDAVREIVDAQMARERERMGGTDVTVNYGKDLSDTVNAYEPEDGGTLMRVRDDEHREMVEEARRRLEDPNASEFEKQAARVVINAYGENAGGDDDGGGNGGGVRLRVRQKVNAADDYEREMKKSGVQVTEALQDSMMGLKKLMQSIVGKDASGKQRAIQEIEGFQNAYLKENRLQSESASQSEEYKIKYYNPLVKAVNDLLGKGKSKERDAARSELTDYMIAKHGLERNEVLAARDAKEAFESEANKDANGNPIKSYDDFLDEYRKKDYSGLTALTGKDNVADAEDAARQMVATYESNHDTAELWDATRAATQATLDKLHDSGVISDEAYDRAKTMFEHYIPLRGWDEKTSDEVYGYLTGPDGPLNGNVYKKAEGRRSKADDPLATIMQMANDAIRQGNRNVMKQRFLTFVLNNPSDLVSVNKLWLKKDDVTGNWEPVFADLDPTDTPEQVRTKTEQFEQQMQQLVQQDPDHYKQSSQKANIPYKVVNNNIGEHRVLVKYKGQTYVLTVNGNPRAAQALNGMTNPDVKGNNIFAKGLEAWKKGLRTMSQLVTTLSPKFVVRNFQRDMLYSITSSGFIKEDKEYGAKFTANYFKVGLMGKLFKKWENGTLDRSDYMEDMFYQFMHNGGETGFSAPMDIEAYKKSLEKQLKKENSKTRQVLSSFGEFYLRANRAVENRARFAAFLTSMEGGRGIDRSIWDAKEVSVNFNKKGAGARMMSNPDQTMAGKIAGVIGEGGSSLFMFWNAAVQGLTNYGKTFKASPIKASAHTAMMAAIGYMMPQLVQAIFGTDDDYYDLPEYVRRNNICFRWSKDMPWITIPLPQEHSVAYAIGDVLAGIASGKKQYFNGEEVFEDFAGEISKALPLDFTEGGGGHGLIPSVAKPIVEAYDMNESWTGAPIANQTDWNEHAPEYQRVYKTASKPFVKASEFLNDISNLNPDETSKGLVNLNPSKIEYLFKGYGGGLTTLFNDCVRMFDVAFTDAEMEAHDIPVVGAMLKSGNPYTKQKEMMRQYYRYRDEAKDAEWEYKNRDDEAKARFKETDRYQRYLVWKEMSKEVDKLKKEMKQNPDVEAQYYEAVGNLVQAMREQHAGKRKPSAEIVNEVKEDERKDSISSLPDKAVHDAMVPLSKDAPQDSLDVKREGAERVYKSEGTDYIKPRDDAKNALAYERRATYEDIAEDAVLKGRRDALKKSVGKKFEDMGTKYKKGSAGWGWYIEDDAKASAEEIRAYRDAHKEELDEYGILSWWFGSSKDSSGNIKKGLTDGKHNPDEVMKKYRDTRKKVLDKTKRR